MDFVFKCDVFTFKAVRVYFYVKLEAGEIGDVEASKCVDDIFLNIMQSYI